MFECVEVHSDKRHGDGEAEFGGCERVKAGRAVRTAGDSHDGDGFGSRDIERERV